GFFPGRRQQGLDFAAKFGVALADFDKKSLSCAGFSRQSRVKNLFNLSPASGIHGGLLCPLISRCSHALARVQSRAMVNGETARTSAVSSTLRPPKNRSSTTLLFRSSTVASRASAESS